MPKTTKKAKAAKRPARKASKAAASTKNGFSQKMQFLRSFQAEHATTMKVLRAYPMEQSEFRPHPRSQCARELAYTFQLEQLLISLAIKDHLKLGGGIPKAPDDMRAIVDAFERDYADLVKLINATPERALVSGKVTFPTGPGKLADWPKMQFLWFILSDQIHHRGQLSVYTRMAGGKVPAIYGPSADEPWS